MARPNAPAVLATYRVCRGREAAFRRLLARDWPVLRSLRMFTAEPPLTHEGRDECGRTFLVEAFTWRSDRAVERAHVHPEVGSVWGAMGDLVENRLGRPAWEFPRVRGIRVRHRAPQRRPPPPRKADPRRRPRARLCRGDVRQPRPDRPGRR